ncbi:MAG: hypothetical protein ACJA0H_001354 [Francisellaceae bacterium]|jgi:hypothetical protein
MPHCHACGLVYSSTERIHLLNCHGGIVIFTDNGRYRQNLTTELNRLSVPYRKITNSRDSWVRDYFFEVNKKDSSTLYIRNDNPGYARRRAGETPPLISPKYSQDRTQETTDIAALRRNRNQFNPKLVSNNLETTSTHCALEGGNLFTCVNNKGIKYHIIGEYALELDAIINFQGRNENIVNFAQAKFDAYPDQQALTRIIAQEKAQASRVSATSPNYDFKARTAYYEQIFDCKQQKSKILVLPNITYHLDLYIAYICRGTFLINSFAENCVSSGHSPGHVEKQKEALKVVATLRKHGFTADIFDGVKYGNIDENHSVWGGNANSSSLVNGIGVNSPVNGRKYFLTIDSPDERHKDSFKSKLAQYKVTPIFLNGERPRQEGVLMTPEETQTDATERSGSLRCQTNILSVLGSKYIINLNSAATKIQRSFKRFLIMRKNKTSTPLATEGAFNLLNVLNESCRNYIEYQNSRKIPNSKIPHTHGLSGYIRVTLLNQKINCQENTQSLLRLTNIIQYFFNGELDVVFGVRQGSSIRSNEMSFISFFCLA